MTKCWANKDFETDLGRDRVAGKTEDRGSTPTVVVAPDSSDAEDVSRPRGNVVETNGAQRGQDLADRVA